MASCTDCSCASRRRVAVGALALVGGASAFHPPAPPLVETRRNSALAFELGTVTTEGLASALVGGAVGTIGSVIAIEAKKVKTLKSKQCPYCMGTGAITCARCLGSGVVMNAAGESAPCPMCNGQCVHSCENCKGRGRFIPTMLDARVSRDPESELEEIGLQ
mmetsp:Transcript_30274/g.102902  ORF Transcript_30274/g.102902 Transcript_30274/m.102902 type:complete len:162 (-) Transcript_30274:22-507(-)